MEICNENQLYERFYERAGNGEGQKRSEWEKMCVCVCVWWKISRFSRVHVLFNNQHTSTTSRGIFFFHFGFSYSLSFVWPSFYSLSVAKKTKKKIINENMASHLLLLVSLTDPKKKWERKKRMSGNRKATIEANTEKFPVL